MRHGGDCERDDVDWNSRDMEMTVRIVASLVLMLAIVAGGWKAWHTADKAGYDRAQREYQAASELQREGNRGKARNAEVKQAAQAEVREEFIVLTVKEIRHETDNLAACVLSPAAVGLLNAAKECASKDRPATCGAGDQVRSAP